MLLAYIDEAGNTGTDLTDISQPVHYLGALLVPEGAWQATKAGVEAIRQFAIERGFDEEVSCELHGTEILQAPKRSGWRALPLADRLTVFDLAMQVIERNGMSLVIGGCDKLLLAKRYSNPAHPHGLAAWLCLERVAMYAKAKQQLVVLIADDGPPAHKQLVRSTLDDYRVNGAPFGPTRDLSMLVDTVHFLDSAASPHIQLCDILLFIQQRYRMKKDPRFEDLWFRCNRVVKGSSILPY